MDSGQRLLETDVDIIEIRDELESDHFIVRSDVRTIEELDNALYNRLRSLYSQGGGIFFGPLID